MNARELLDNLRGRGVVLRAYKGGLNVTAPKGELTPAEKAAITAAKPELLAILAGRAVAPPRPLGAIPGKHELRPGTWQARAVRAIWDVLHSEPEMRQEQWELFEHSACVRFADGMAADRVGMLGLEELDERLAESALANAPGAR